MSTTTTTATFATLYGPEGRIGHAFLTEAGVDLSIRSAHHAVILLLRFVSSLAMLPLRQQPRQ